MNITLTDLGSIAAIVSVPLMLLTWLVTRERFAEFWKKRFKLVLALTVAFSGLAGLWRIGWLNWLQYQVTWPVWGLLLYPLVVLCALAAIGALILYIDSRHDSETLVPTRQYFTIYGARWYFYENTIQRPPVCDRCLMEMRNVSMPGYIDPYPVEGWQCRRCGHEIRWDCARQGDLLEDVRAHYNSELRRALEQQD